MRQKGKPDLGPAERISTSSPCPPTPSGTGVWLRYCPLDGWHECPCVPGQAAAACPQATQNNHLGQGIEWAQRDPQPHVDSDSLPSQGPFGGLSIISPLPPSLGWGGGGFRGHENTTCPSDWLWASWGRMCFSWPGSLTLSLVLSPPT